MCHVRYVHEGNGRKRDDVMHHHHRMVFSSFLEPKDGHGGLLYPIGGMDEIKHFERGVVCLMRKSVKEAGHVKEPQRRPFHDDEGKDRDGGEVDSLV